MSEITEERRLEILNKYAQQADAEIQAEQAKSAEQQLTARLESRIAAMSEELAVMQKFPSKYKQQIEQTNVKLSSLYAQLESLTPSQQAINVQAGGYITTGKKDITTIVRR